MLLDIDWVEGTLDAVANVLDLDILTCEFELWSCYKIQFRTNTFGKGKDILNLLSYGLKSTTTVVLQGWLWQKTTHNGWFIIKEN